MEKRNKDKQKNKHWVTVGNRINSLLAEQDKTQKELAEKLEIKPNVISYFCKGDRTPNTEQIVKIAKFFNVSTDYLLGLTDIKSTDTTIQDICEYTGLNEEACNNLIRIKTLGFSTIYGEIKGQKLMEINNMILTDNLYSMLLYDIALFKNNYNTNNSTLPNNSKIKHFMKENKKLLSEAGFTIVHNSTALRLNELEAIDTFKRIFKQIYKTDK